MGSIPRRSIIALALLLSAAAAAQQSGPSTATGEWPTYGGDLAKGRTSTDIPELISLSLP